MPVILKYMEVCWPHQVEQEVEALHAVRGKPHILQEIHPKYHHTGPGDAWVVTRSVTTPLAMLHHSFTGSILPCMMLHATGGINSMS